MAANLNELADEGRRDRLLIKKAEKELKNSFISRIIPSLNSHLHKHYLLMLQAVNQCLLRTATFDSPDSLDQCIAQAEAGYFRKQDLARASLLTFQQECQDCLNTCKSDMNQSLAKCYQDCLVRFKNLSDEL